MTCQQKSVTNYVCLSVKQKRWGGGLVRVKLDKLTDAFSLHLTGFFFNSGFSENTKRSVFNYMFSFLIRAKSIIKMIKRIISESLASIFIHLICH